MTSGWGAWDEEADSEAWTFRAPLSWRIRLWILNDLARLRFWRG